MLVNNLLAKATQASSDWFYAQLFERFDCKPVQWLSSEALLHHLGMALFQDRGGTCLKYGGFAPTMLVKLQMEDCCSQRRIRTPMRRPIAISDFNY